MLNQNRFLISLLSITLAAVAGCGSPQRSSTADDGTRAADHVPSPSGCGHAGEPCCPPNGQDEYACNGDGSDYDYRTLECNHGMCERCGVVGMKCCSLNHQYWCDAYNNQVDDSNQLYNCVNDICQFMSGPPPKPTCNGQPATSTANTFTVAVRDPNGCANALTLFANSLADAQQCATKQGYGVRSGYPQAYYVAQTSKASGICIDNSIEAFSQDDAKSCVHAACRPGDTCTETIGTCTGFTGAVIPTAPFTPSCSASGGCDCSGSACSAYAYIGCATINGTQVAQIQNADGTWSSFATAAPNAPIVLFNDYASRGSVTYRVCNADTSPLMCTPPLTATVPDVCSPPPPPPKCRPGYHWCGDDDGCYPNSRLCD